MICKTCNGTGHDKDSRPQIRFKDYVDSSGRKRKQHITVKQGSGCLKCGGRGKI